MRPTEPDDRDQIEEVLAEVLASDDVDAALESACGADPAIAAQLREAYRALAGGGLLADPVAVMAERVEAGVGGRIAGFELLEVLGRGGMGIVYRARDSELGRDVALKVLRPELLHFDDSRQRFQREIQMASKLRHPGIVSVFSAGASESGVPFFTMEVVEGRSLSETVSALRGRPLSKRSGADFLAGDVERRRGDTGSGRERLGEDWVVACLQVVRAVAEALAHAHEAGVFHRDIKPSNVVVDAHERARLLDFGLAHFDEGQAMTSSRAMLGSLPYMAPEQIDGRLDQFGGRQDVYSLGVTLFELLTLTQPFLAATTEETQRRVLCGERESLRALGGAFGRDVETVCGTAMELDPTRRYAGAQDFAADLDRLLEHRPVAARPAGILLRSWRLVQRHPTACVAVMLGIAVLVASSLAAIAARRAEQAAIAGKRELLDANLAFVTDYVDTLRELPGGTAARAKLLSPIAEQLEQLELDLADDPGALLSICQVHIKLAQVVGGPDTPNVGQREDAKKRFQHVLDLIGRSEDVPAPAAAGMSARALGGLATIESFDGRLDEALALQRRAVEVLAPHIVEDSESTVGRWLLRQSLAARVQVASLEGMSGRHEHALEEFSAIRDIHRRQMEQRPQDEKARREYARQCANVARALYRLQRNDEAIESYRVFIDELDGSLDRAPDDAQRLFDRLYAGITFPEMLIVGGRVDEAIEFCTRDLERCEQLAAVDDNAVLDDVQLHMMFGLGWAHQRRVLLSLSSDELAEAQREDLRIARRWMVKTRERAVALQDSGRLRRAIRPERIDKRLAQIEELLRRP